VKKVHDSGGLVASIFQLSLPSSDLQIFACARYHRARIEHCDEHFAKAEAHLS
jgi:hypothetical protein